MSKYARDSNNNSNLSRLTRQKYWWRTSDEKTIIPGAETKCDRKHPDGSGISLPPAYLGKKRDPRDFW